MNLLRKYLKNARFSKSFEQKRQLLEDSRFTMPWEMRYPCLNDATSTTGFDSHYLFHTAWAARILANTRPNHHVDISSCLRFVSIVSAFIPIEFYDYRPAQLNLPGLQSKQADLMNLPFSDCSISSISCMHVIEHIGLERYGDPLDPRGDLKAIAELKRVTANNGDLLFVVPLGSQPIIQYNAHRIYTYDQIISYFADFNLINFSYIDDAGGFTLNALKNITNNQTYGCGCFHFKKKLSP
jgi:SAM-dependent methyltransferase